MLMIIQETAAEQHIQIAQETVIAIIAASTLVVLGLLWLISRFAAVAPASEGPLKYGNFFVVIFGIMTVLIGFLVAFPLVISDVFTEPTQVLALLSALFGTIVGLVGTYFGVKSSADASDKAQDATQEAQRVTQAVIQGRNGPPGGLPGGPPNGGEPPNETATERTTRRFTAARSITDPGKTGPHDDQTDLDSPSQEEGERPK